MAIHGTVKSSVLAADGTAVTGKGFLYGIVISGAAGEVIVYDNTAASGTKLLQANAMGNYWFDAPIPFTIGVRVDLTANIVTVLWQDAP